MVVSRHKNPSRMTVLVDPEAPLIWREAPYIAQLQAWAREVPVTVMVGLRAFAIYPMRVDDLGELAGGEFVEITEITREGRLEFVLRRCAP
jgi:hypothetical protein